MGRREEVVTTDFEHPLVGRQVVYRAGHPGARPEQGMVTSVNTEAGIVFVNYGRGSTSQATSANDLTLLDGSPVELHGDSGEKDAEDKDLGDILPEKCFDHVDYCDSRRYYLWERDVAEPALRALGYSVGSWWSGDEDSFGPLVRCVSITKDDVTEVYCYG